MAAEPLPIFDPEGNPHLTLVETPPGVPPPEIPIVTIGRGLGWTWDHLWNWTKAHARDAISWADITADPAGQKIISFVENYVGASQHAMATIVNNLSDFAYDTANQAAHAFDWTFQHISWLEGLMNDVVGGLAADLNDLIHLNLPGLVDDLANQIHALRADTFNALAQVPAWAIDNIFDPLHDEIGRVNENIRRDVHGAVDAVRADLADLARQTGADIGALLNNMELVVGPLALAVGELQRFKDECAEPMCQTMGPKTDLGKLLKAIQAAGILALLLEVGNMTEADVENRIREIAGDLGHIVSTFDGVFVGGGGSLIDFGKALL
jgi:hypothetical protein